MKRFILSFIGLSLFFASYSSPIIGKVIKKSYQAYSKDMPVLVCWSEADLPPSYETLGTLQVKDNKGTAYCDSTSVMELLKKETRKSGGNVLHITAHRTPAPGSGGCHQMMGTILRTSEAYLREKFPETYADVLSPYILKRQNKLSTTRLEIGAGYALRTAGTIDGLTPMWDYFVDKLKSGASIHASFDFFPVKHFGLGIMYYTYRAHSDMWVSTDLNGNGGAMICRDAVNFVAPAVLFRSPMGSRWTFDARLAPGYINYREKLSLLKENATGKGASFGFHAAVSAECSLGEHIGIFFNISTTQGWLSKVSVEGSMMEEETVPTDQGSGEIEALSQINFGAGFRIHFN